MQNRDGGLLQLETADREQILGYNLSLLIHLPTRMKEQILKNLIANNNINYLIFNVI